MSGLKVPIICTVIGEGGSGGALAIGIGDRVMMCQYSVYSVISPEGCASILWKSAARAQEAAEAMGITADKLLSLGLIDQIIAEPLGGAHRHPHAMSEQLKIALSGQMQTLNTLSLEQRQQQRYDRLRSFGIYSRSFIHLTQSNPNNTLPPFCYRL
jgi:acetyl-CoA carboxylase carboxyl transferase subunit alpha